MYAQSHVTAARESALSAAIPVPHSRAATMRDAAAPEAMACGPGAHPRGFDLARIPIAPLQRKATISSPGDAFEREADDVADKVMRMADAPEPTAAPPAIQRKCASCEDEEKHIHTQRATLATPAASLDTGAAVHAAAGGGAPLSHDVRSYFEPRFGRDFSQVRVHTDGAAVNAARSVQARAYTLGRDIVFGSGAYAPASNEGRRLIAHELTHVVQQGGRAGRMQRKLSVDEKASDDPKTAASTIDTLIKSLCPDFEVAKGGLVTPKKGSDCAGFKFAKIAKGKQPLGCCCLCTLTAAPAAWRIIVTTKDSPTTDPATHEVRMTPTSGTNAPDLRYWTGGPTQAVKAQPSAEAFGHELCGHAALMQIKAHPPSFTSTPDRAFSDVHDPTVRIQDALAKEMGSPGDRGLAGGGTHRGESLRVFTIGPFAADAADPSPFAAQVKGAVAFMNGNTDLFVDAVGFRDKTDTKAAVSADRATKVQAEVKKGVKALTTKVQTTPKGAQETLDRVQPATDGGVDTKRIVDLRMAVKPAGLIKPIGAAPPAKPVHVDPEFPAVVKALKSGKVPNECHKLLADNAWP